MVDYSGIAVDTYKMTSGLFDAYNKALTDRQNREKTAAEMERAAHKTKKMRQVENAFQNGGSTPQELVGALFGSEQAAQALEAMKMQPNVWSQFGLRQPAGLQQGNPQQMPLQPPLPPASPAPQYEMSSAYKVRQHPPAPGRLPLNLVRRWNEDRANQKNGMPLAWPDRARKS